MASFDDFFPDKVPTGPKWEKEDDAHTLTATGEPERVQEIDWTTKKPKFMVQAEEGGKWTVANEGSFDATAVANHFPVMNIKVPGVWEDGTEGSLVVSGKEQTKAFKDAWEEFGDSIDSGVLIGKKLTAIINGKQKVFRFKMQNPKN